MKRWALRSLLVLATLILLAAGISYSWTYTPIGRLDYVAAVMAKVASWQTGPAELTPETRRAANAQVEQMLSFVPETPLARIEDRALPGPGGHAIPVRIYWPEAPGPLPLPLYLDIHGGGWWMGNGFPFHAVTTGFAAATGAIVVSVDYRLAPEHPFPAALDDCAAVLRWMHANASELGGDPERIAIGGASAGGNLAAALALRTRDEGGPRIAFQYLFVPAVDLSGRSQWPSYQEAGDAYVLKTSQVESMFAAYVPEPAERANPYVSPLLADDLSGLPPALVVTAHFDPLRDEGEAYAHALEAAGVEVRLHREQGLHGLMGSPERAGRVQAMAAETVRRALGQGVGRDGG
ncbi:MAG: alpha/beta hydrolase [Deltaproteobacteria bacterium]|nr:alpha/beta hydrolase [Deltaproteobacteria bacterium]MBW2422351.1 alpha/beta hydrolase [Deltaproteobacteria bacterium]